MSETQKYFETRTELTLEEYKRFDTWMHKNLTGMNRIFTIAKIVLIALCIVLAVFSWNKGDVVRTVGELVLAVLIFPVFALVHTISAQRTYQMIHKQQDGAVQVYRLYTDHIEQVRAQGNTQIAYDKLYRIAETKTNFYLMLSKMQGIILVKKNCDEQTIAFLHTLVQQ